MADIIISIRVDEKELWSAVFGASPEFFPWYRSIHFKGGGWETPGLVTVSMDDPDDEDKAITKDLTITEIAAAWAEAVSRDLYHCGTPLRNIDDFDSCASDIVLQLAVLGDVVYG